MNLSNRPKTTEGSKKRLGRGYGSGKGGHTVGRGTKGRKARGKVPLQFEGVAAGSSFYKRLPLLRGKGKLKPDTKKIVGVNVKYLNILKKDTQVTIETLIKHHIVGEKAKETGVKILGDGELSVALAVTLPTSKGAREKIEKAGGTVGEQKEKQVARKETKSPSIKSTQKLK
ncbi:MAG: 50S ribosomal protein L15 [Microgenomates group bacterium GW2011_GWC1_41_8]|uniref:Large ribosomal subunit protein uL15 n=3 Tax=Candidatus Roizmaniibacteriota TaxID=1752723 RepID=A0A0G0XEB9_9BACT|nr:MAG: 50S ribosomal protein L15 [Candidatus Roizmanbacteria bacterium GW2011_GWB1_40_7]KKR94570.1 MAG: 50S ribosomal protein L15 [Candidatus Roizmanbacteria bacterium GW2011_GWA1_41_13]KKS23170.1 MAG: 50S ribosomal protein L15 [Candidatus Roizmanbacteria bacterium GW2011_GWC2_41_7]KKS24258.1 MAG: 50S ribosomal protein L15 [Microgenomates group bacterium GW2011_GWC1_41_8]OGK48410.1 MAG: 50S ribosomal protein L15 [Candidatus Roizmanbacteria bacterium RIFCSPLOWO2_01_FULL_40_14]